MSAPSHQFGKAKPQLKAFKVGGISPHWVSFSGHHHHNQTQIETFFMHLLEKVLKELHAHTRDHDTQDLMLSQA